MVGGGGGRPGGSCVGGLVGRRMHDRTHETNDFKVLRLRNAWQDGAALDE